MGGQRVNTLSPIRKFAKLPVWGKAIFSKSPEWSLTVMLLLAPLNKTDVTSAWDTFTPSWVVQSSMASGRKNTCARSPIRSVLAGASIFISDPPSDNRVGKVPFTAETFALILFASPTKPATKAVSGA